MPSPSLRTPGLARRSLRTLVDGGVRTALHHPRTAMTVRASVAATVAWLLARHVPGGSEYAFYAPFGAVVTTYPAVARSTTETVRAVTAILLGGGVGLAAAELVPWDVAAVGIATALGVLVAGLPALGADRSYVPVAAIFVLLVGQGREVGYALSYAGLFLLGALVTIVLSVAFPTVPVTRADRAVQSLRAEVADHLRHMAASLHDDDAGPGPTRERLTVRLGRAREAVDDVLEARRGNRRARRRRDAITRVRGDFAVLERVVLLIDDLHELSADEPWGTRVSGIAPELRVPMAAAVAALADAVTTVGPTDTEAGRRTAVDDAVTGLATALHEHERRTGPQAQGLVVATVLTTLRRTLSAMTPADRIGLSSSPWPDPPPPAPEPDPEPAPEPTVR